MSPITAQILERHLQRIDETASGVIALSALRAQIITLKACESGDALDSINNYHFGGIDIALKALGGQICASVESVREHVTEGGYPPS
jgi:hypothetical protein